MKDYVGKMVRQKRPKGKNGECRDTAKVTIVKNGIKRIYSLGRWGSQEAEKAYNQLMVQYYSNTLEVNSDKRLIANFLQECTNRIQEEKLVGSRKSHAKKVIAWFNELFGKKLCSELSFNMLTVFRDSILYEARKNNWTKYYANKLLCTMKRMLTDGVIKGWFDSSLLPLIQTYPSINEKLKQVRTRSVVDDAVVETTLKYLKQPYIDAIRIIRSACLRPNELTKIRKQDIEIKEGCWVVRVKSKTERYGYPRIIVFTEEEQQILKKWIKEDDDVLFRSRTGRPLSYFAIKFALIRAIAKARKAGENIPNWTLYQLRHTAFTENVKKYGVEVASKLAGHANFNMAKLYDHSTESILIQLAQSRSKASKTA